MALPLKPGLMPTEVAFLCEMELVTVIPRQRLESLELLGGPTEALNPPFPTPLPLWLALLLKRQRRANILPPAWLHPSSLTEILSLETEHFTETFTPSPSLPPPSTTSSSTYLAAHATELELSSPFLPAATRVTPPDALPYHWLELSHLLLQAASDDIEDADAVRRLVRDLREVRMAKVRKGTRVLDAGAGVQMNGVGGMEVAEARGFVGGVVDGLRKIGASREMARRERDGDDGNGYAGGRDEDDDDDDDDDMLG